MTANIKYKREQLGRHWGPAPFGCERNGYGHLIPSTRTYYLNRITNEARLDFENSEIPASWQQRNYYDGLVQMYKLYSTSQYSYDTVAEMLNEAGWRYCAEAKRFKPRDFTRDDVRRSLSMWQLFKGDLPLGNITRGDGPILEGGHESILPVELCELVGQIRERRNRQYSRRRKGTAHFYLLSGVLHCGVCQKKLKGYFQDGRRLYRHYGSKKNCSEKWVVADEIESKALEQIGTLADSDLLAEIKAEADRLAREVFSTNDSNRAILAELDRQRKRLSRLEDLYLDEEIDKQRYRIRKADIDQTIGEIEQKLYNATQTVNFGQVIDRMAATLNKIPLATPETKKALINSIYERLEVCNGEITHTIPRPWAQPFF